MHSCRVINSTVGFLFHTQMYAYIAGIIGRPSLNIFEQPPDPAGIVCHHGMDLSARSHKVYNKFAHKKMGS